MSAQIEFLPVRYEEPLELDFEGKHSFFLSNPSNRLLLSRHPPESPTLPLIGEPPAVGYATWTTPNVDELKSGLRAALDAGYRFIDTAGLLRGGTGRRRRRAARRTYRVLERHARRGHFRSLGVANLNAAQLLQLWTAAEIKPTCLQLELHSLHPPADLMELCERLGVRITAYAPFGHSSGSSSGTHGLAERHAKTASQLLIRQLLQRGVGVLPLSTRPERVFENADVFDFELDDDEMGQFDVMNKELQQPSDLLQIQGPRFIRNDVLYFTILRSLYCGT
ncbi:alcohol dehydrogenase [Aphelenchoides fujianensis]|nr:alcohol dehydrogenase [Aphelenchoides fujianensis]